MGEFIYDAETIKQITTEIKSKQSIRNYIEEVIPGARFSYAGGNKWTIPCPLHGGTRKGSFFVYEKGVSDFWICYGTCHHDKPRDLIDFAVLYNNLYNDKQWRRMDAINFFSKRFGISHEVTDADLADRVYHAYINSIEGPLKEDDNIISINHQVSMAIKNIVQRHDYHQVRELAEHLYSSMDRCIVEISSEDRVEKGKARQDLDMIQHQLVPAFEKFSSDLDVKKSQLVDIAKENKSCTACYLRYKCNNVLSGTGDFLSGILILDSNPSKEEDEEGLALTRPSYSILRKALRDIGVSEKDVWIDYVSNCYQERFQERESIICKKLWLDRKLEILNPRVVVCLGRDAAAGYLEQPRLNFSNVIWRKVQYNGADVWFLPHPDSVGSTESERYSEFRETLRNLLCNPLQKRIK